MVSHCALVASSLASGRLSWDLTATFFLKFLHLTATIFVGIAKILENLGETFLDHWTTVVFQNPSSGISSSTCTAIFVPRGSTANMLLFNKLPFKSFNLAANEVHSCSLASLRFPFHPVILTKSEDGSLGLKTTDILSLR